jgi:two-component system, chemotaxis family, protein-glutamate methylesterase/glutaminase
MSTIRVLVVDDSAVIRRMLAKLIDNEQDLEVVGTAGNGQIAIDKIERLKPDILTLDVEMPVLDGLGTLKEMRKRHIHLPVIMFSTLTSRGASTTMEALGLGASDYVTKPEGMANLAASFERLRGELLPRLRALTVSSHRFAERQKSSSTPASSTSPAVGGTGRPAGSLGSTLAAPGRASTAGVSPSRPPLGGTRGVGATGLTELKDTPKMRQLPEALIIGVSTGGPNALNELLPTLPASFPIPILVVQHMPPIFTTMLAERLNNRCALTVREVEDLSRPKAGEIWIARGGVHMHLERDARGLILRTRDGEPEHSCRPSVDVLFRSAVEVCQRPLLAAILTGMGRDGATGAAHVREAGGRVFVQDEESSVVWGMPGAVVSEGQCDAQFSITQMGSALQHALNMRAASQRGGQYATGQA